MKPSSSFWWSSSSSWNASLFSLVLAGLSLAVTTALVFNKGQPPSPPSSSSDDNKKKSNGKSIQFACLGNSIQYYNDCPRLLEKIFQVAGYETVTQDSCLRGGATISSLWKKGNGMKDKFILRPALQALKHDFGAPTVKDLLSDQKWDFVIINDHTQWPARAESRDESLAALEDYYVPLLKKQSQATPILIMTAGYRVPKIRGTEDLGDFDHYTSLLKKGCDVYKEKLDAWLHQSSSNPTRIAPVGLAYATIYHTDRDLWYRLYNSDDFHPSPLGTLLQAFVLYITMTGEAPPDTYDETTWWGTARRMQPPNEDPLPLPSHSEASTLWAIAREVCFQCGLTQEPIPSNLQATKIRNVAMQVCGISD